MPKGFQKGNKLAPGEGRPKGSKNKTTLIKEKAIEAAIEKVAKTWEEKLEDALPDDLLLDIHKEGLEAGKSIYKNNNKTGKIEKITYEADYATRHKYLETALKIKKKMPMPGTTVPIQINFNKDKEEYA